MASAPDVSVCVQTYNQQAYIRQALDGILGQETELRVEIIVGDDASTDATPEILRGYHSIHPERVQLILRSTNSGGPEITRALLKAATGRYVAMLDGDDYWTFPGKLDAQVRFLDAHPDYAASAHNADVVVEGGSGESYLYCGGERPEIYGVEDLLGGNPFPTSSMVYRNHLFKELPSWVVDAQDRYRTGDWPINVLHALYGRVRYFHQAWAVYRRHPHGVWSSSSRRLAFERSLGVLGSMRQGIDERYWRALTSHMARWRLDLATHEAIEGQLTAALSNSAMAARLLVECRRGLSRDEVPLVLWLGPRLGRGLLRRGWRRLRASW